MKNLIDVAPYRIAYVDGMNLMARSHYGMSTMAYLGKPTGMLYGALRLVVDWEKRNPGIVFVFLWEGRNSWRKAAHPIYKSNRDSGSYSESTTRFFSCVDYVREVLPFFGVTQMWADTFEADDLAFSLSGKIEGKTIFVSTDWDWWPLSNAGDILYQNDVLGPVDMQERFEKKFGVRINMSRLWLFKVLTGDPSDGLSGVPRFPKHLAASLCNTIGINLENVPSALEAMGEFTWSKKVRDNKWILDRNYELVTPAAVPNDAVTIVTGNYDKEKIKDILISNGMEVLYDRAIGGS